MQMSILWLSARGKSSIARFGRMAPRRGRAIDFSSVEGQSGSDLFAGAAAQSRFRIFAIQFCNEACADFGRTDRFALVSVSAIAETFCVHRLHHTDDPPGPFRF